MPYSKYRDLLYADGVDAMFVVDTVRGGGYETLQHRILNARSSLSNEWIC